MNARPDFADWLSPMLVKELRQGMRSRLFVISFLVLQAAMILLAVIGLAVSARQEDTSAITGFFWTIISVPLLLVMPMSGLAAVMTECKANTLELIFLTRLTPRRIIAGKWFAIVAQTVLLVCAVLPYAVLRYFLGGINVATELTLIGTLLLISALLSGIAVGFSPQSTRLARALLVMAVVFGLQTVPSLLFGFGMGGAIFSGPRMDWRTYLQLAGCALIGLLLMIEFGASRIAPLAENHSTSRRLLGLVVAAVVATFGRQTFSRSPLWTCSFLLLAPICVGVLCEPPRLVASIYRPFVRLGLIGKIAGRVLYPGWPSGVFFDILVLLVLLGSTFFQARGALDTKWLAWVGTVVAGTLFVPAAIIRMSAPRTRRPFGIYLGIQITFALLAGLSAALESAHVADFRLVAALIPTCGLLLAGSKGVMDQHFTSIFAGTGLVTAASFCFLVIKMRRPWREIRALETAAATLPNAAELDATQPVTAS